MMVKMMMLDFESWNADFICSIACSGSNPFVKTGDVEET